MRYRSWPLLIVAFGSLVVLIGLSSLGALRRAQQIYTDVRSIYEGYRQTELLLYEIRSGIYLSSIFVRDYLLDPSHIAATLHRNRLLEVRSSMSARMKELDSLAAKDDPRAVQMLREEVDAYWDSLEPIFEWTPPQKLALSSLFLRQQVLPRRDKALAMAGQIGDLTASNFKRQQERMSLSQRDFRRHLLGLMAVALSLGLLVAVLSIARITRLERRAGEERARVEHAEQELRRLSQQIVQAQEAERKSISRELHDEVGQMLTALRMDLASLEELRQGPDEEFQKRLAEAKDLAEKTVRAVRSLAMGLRPAMLDDLGLAPALEWQAREFARRIGVPVAVQIDGELDGLPDSHRTCVYRVVQESLTNCARHAKAGNIRITVHGRRDWLTLTVQDDGEGFDREASVGRGMGLIGIEERARELGGNVEIFSQPRRGTLLKVELPVRREEKA